MLGLGGPRRDEMVKDDPLIGDQSGKKNLPLITANDLAQFYLIKGDGYRKIPIYRCESDGRSMVKGKGRNLGFLLDRGFFLVTVALAHRCLLRDRRTGLDRQKHT